MQAYIGVLALCTLAGVLSCAFSKVFDKNKYNVHDIIKTFAFYFFAFYAALSLFKTLLGYGNLGLADTFDEVSWRTYLHYSLPIVVASIVIPLLLKKIFREKLSDFVNLSLSVAISIYSVVYLIFGKNNNLLCVCIAAVSIVLALMILFFYKKEVLYYTKQNLKSRLALAVPVILFWTIMMVLFLPNELYLNNVDDMVVPYDIFISTLFIGALGYFVIYTVFLVYFLSERQFDLVCNIIFAITVTGYVQSIILNGNINVMDGTKQTWSILTMAVNGIVWLAIIGVIVLLKYIIKKNTNKAYSMICIYISIIQLVTWGYMGFTTETMNTETDFELMTDGQFELDSDHNVIVFVLDWFDIQIMDRILEKDADFLEPLEDFTWYQNMSSLYAYTKMSVPYLLTDVEWQYDMSEEEYREYAFGDRPLLRDIADNNYDIGLYTFKNVVSESVADIVSNYYNITVQGWDYDGILEQMIKCSKYKCYPFAMKGEYWYTGGELTYKLRDTNIYNAERDDLFYEALTSDGIKINDADTYDGVYKFYHLNGVHPPFDPDMESQGQWCMNVVYEYLEQLKSAGVYDEATIIITADHGHNYLIEGYIERLEKYNLEMPSSPILFVKKSYQVNEDGMEISMAPVSHEQFGATVMEAVSGDGSRYGETFEEVEEDRQSKRYFIARRHDDIQYVKYLIDGYVRDWNNWSIEEDNY